MFNIIQGNIYREKLILFLFNVICNAHFLLCTEFLKNLGSTIVRHIKLIKLIYVGIDLNFPHGMGSAVVRHVS